MAAGFGMTSPRPRSASGRARALARIRDEAAACRACPLYRDATQAVVGEGPSNAGLMLVGEQPGDREDLAGHPFVGPAGRILDQALEEAGIDRSAVFVTNAVKHFKFRMRGARRIHQRPAAGELGACRPWLAAEIELVAPEAIVALGATASHSLLGRPTGVREHRGRLLRSPLFEPPVLITVHPSSVLRERDGAQRKLALQALTDDLRVVASLGLAQAAS
jgi:uracil-DNA glycosylase